MSSSTASSSSSSFGGRDDTAIDLGTGLLQPVNIRPSLRPLSSSRLANAPGPSSSSRLDTLKSLSHSTGSLEAMDTPPKLKRLSLIPSPAPPIRSEPGTKQRPGSLDLDRLLDSQRIAEGGSENDGRRAGPSTPRSARRLGIRSSISYSPATSTAPHSAPPVRSATALEEALKRTSSPGTVKELDGKVRGGPPVASPGGSKERKSKEKKRGQTLTEKHGELLTLIAAKERKVSELKQELAAQEASLGALKSRWTSIIARSTTPRITQTAPSTSRAPLPPSNAIRTISPDRIDPRPTLSPSSTLSAVSESPEQSPGRPEWAYLPPHLHQDESMWNNLLSNTLSMGGVQPAQASQALAEGKKFWGKLVETVSAAAVGTAPGTGSADGSVADSDEGEPANHPLTSPTSVAKLDLASLRGMLPWSSTHPPTPSGTTTKPPMPANSMRLPSRQGSASSYGSTSSTQSLVEKPRRKETRPGGQSGLDDLLGGDDLLGEADAVPLDVDSFRPTVQAARRDGKEKATGKDPIGEAENEGWGWL